jgi:hypothetical protein
MPVVWPEHDRGVSVAVLAAQTAAALARWAGREDLGVRSGDAAHIEAALDLLNVAHAVLQSGLRWTPSRGKPRKKREGSVGRPSRCCAKDTTSARRGREQAT